MSSLLLSESELQKLLRLIFGYGEYSAVYSKKAGWIPLANRCFIDFRAYDVVLDLTSSASGSLIVFENETFDRPQLVWIGDASQIGRLCITSKEGARFEITKSGKTFSLIGSQFKASRFEQILNEIGFHKC